MAKIQNKLPPKPVEPPKSSFGWLFIIGLLFCLVFGYTWIRTESRRTILAISDANNLLAETQSRNQALAVEISRLKSDERIIEIAKTRLNLNSNTVEQTIYFSGASN